MKLARILLASAAVALLAACGSDPIGPSGAAERIKPRHSVTTDTTAVNADATTDNAATLQESTGCIDTSVIVGGISTTIRVCDGRGPHMGSGQ